MKVYLSCDYYQNNDFTSSQIWLNFEKPEYLIDKDKEKAWNHDSQKDILLWDLDDWYQENYPFPDTLMKISDHVDSELWDSFLLGESIIEFDLDVVFSNEQKEETFQKSNKKSIFNNSLKSLI